MGWMYKTEHKLLDEINEEWDFLKERQGDKYDQDTGIALWNIYAAVRSFLNDNGIAEHKKYWQEEL